MEFDMPLVEAVLERRYKRFLADVRLENGTVTTLHCPNTGSMKGCCEPGSRVWFSDSRNDKRKYRYTWELVETAAGHRICINTGLPNRLVEEAIANDVIAELSGYARLRREVRYGEENSRIDLMLDECERDPRACYIEVKNVTLLGKDGAGYFPDAVSTRGQKHLRELMQVARDGSRAVLLFCVNHTGIESVSPADDIDPEYGDLLREADQNGVEIMAWASEISPDSVILSRRIPVLLA